MKPQAKVVPFAQYVNDELYVISQELSCFSLEEYGDVIMSSADRFFDRLSIGEEEIEYYYPYYFWWMVFCSRGKIVNNRTIYQMFLQKNLWKYKKRPHLKEALLKWQYVIPSFYYIKEIGSERVFCLYDIFDQRQILKVVIIPQDTFKQPAKGDVLAGLVLPMVGGGYFSVVDLMIIPDKIRSPLISKLIRFYESDITVSTNEFFSKNYPIMLRKTIKHLIDNKIKNTVKVYR